MWQRADGTGDPREGRGEAEADARGKEGSSCGRDGICLFKEAAGWHFLLSCSFLVPGAKNSRYGIPSCVAMAEAAGEPTVTPRE